MIRSMGYQYKRLGEGGGWEVVDLCVTPYLKNPREINSFIKF